MDRATRRARSRGGIRRSTSIDVPNGGLSAARNLGLAEATGEIVAYTDADVRVDPDWLTYLVQPFLTSDVVGSGGPNVVPPDDPFVAQCVARSPGGPTHVLLDDRIAEHVPGCNMAFRRDALLAIGGFNPVYLRAGDDVDVCWRLQAKGQKIGFSPAALVWHHHRASVKAYWRQQVGYGEGETWLDAHHPEKFVARHDAVARAHLQSAAVRPLALGPPHQHRRVGHGGIPVASTAPTSHPAAVPAALAGLAGASPTLLRRGGRRRSARRRTPGLRRCCCWRGALGWVTHHRAMPAVRLALRSRRVCATPPRGRPAVFVIGSLIAWLHFLQPLARFYGRLRGMLSPPLVVAPDRVTRRAVEGRRSRPLRTRVPRRCLLMGGATEQQFWSESWVSHDALLTELTGVAARVTAGPPHRGR